MATKHEIRKYLERKMNEALVTLEDEFQATKKEIQENFLYEHRNEIAGIKRELSSADDRMDTFIANAKEDGVELSTRYYENPKRLIVRAFDSVSSSSLLSYLTFSEIGKLEVKHSNTQEDTKNEYLRLIGTTQAMGAKDGIELLKNLGFDVSELLVEKVTTAITTVFDTKKLFISVSEEEE